MKKENHRKFKALGAVFLAIVMAATMISVNAFAMKKTKKTEMVMVTYDLNGGKDGTLEPEEFKYGTLYTVRPCTATPPEGKEFDCWIRNGTRRNPGDRLILHRNYNFKAQWKDLHDSTVHKVFVTFDSNGREGIMPRLEVILNDTDINKFVVPQCEFTSPLGEAFDAWLYLDPNGGENILFPGDEVEICEDMNLIALWKGFPVPGQAVIVSFNSNGGTGEMIPIELLPDSVLKLPENEFTSPEGKIFDHWLYVDGNNGEHKYYPGNDVTVYSNMEFLAVWKNVTPKRIIIKINPNGGTLKPKYEKEKVVVSPYSYVNPDAETYLKDIVTPPTGKTIEAVEFNGKRVPFSEKLTLKNDTEIKILWKNIETPEKVKPEKPETPKKEKSEKISPKKKDIVKTSDDNGILLALSVLGISFTGAILLMKKETVVKNN